MKYNFLRHKHLNNYQIYYKDFKNFNIPEKIRKGQQLMQTIHMPMGSHPQIRLDALYQRKRQYHWIHQDQMIIVFNILF